MTLRPILLLACALFLLSACVIAPYRGGHRHHDDRPHHHWRR